MTLEKSGLGEQALNKMAEMALASQIETAENLQVQVKVDPSNLAKGEVDSLAISGEGLVMHPDLRMAELQMQINSIAVKPFKALFGRIELVRPTDGTARVVITKADLDHAFNSETINERLRQLVIHLDGKQATIKSMHVACNLLSGCKITLLIDAILYETEGTIKAKPPQLLKRGLAPFQPEVASGRMAGSIESTPTSSPIQHFSFTASLSLSNDQQGVALKDIQYLEGKEPPLELTNALVEWAGEILNLQNFEMEGISLRIHQLNVEAGNLVLQAEALVTQFPTS